MALAANALRGMEIEKIRAVLDRKLSCALCWIFLRRER